MSTKAVNKILAKHSLTLKSKRSKIKKTVKINPINLGGRQGEDLTENELIRSGLSFSRQPVIDVPSYFFEEKRKRFDFAINHNNETIYVEAKYQKVEGSVKDKIAGFIWGLTFLDEKVVVVLNGKAFKDKYVNAMVNRIQSNDHLNERIKIIKGPDFYDYLMDLKT